MPLVSAFTLRLCLVLIVVGGVCTQAQAPKKGKGKSQNQQSPASQQSPTPQPQATPIQTPVEQPKPDETRQERQQQQEQTKGWFTPEWMTVLLNALLLIAIAVQCGIAWQQWRLMREMLVVSEKQATALETQTKASQTAADAAELSAKAAQESAKIAVQSFTIGERPYLFVEETKLERLITGGRPAVKIRIRNGGRTPALEFWADITFSVEPKQPGLIYAEAVDEQATVFFAAGGEVTLASEAPFSLSNSQIGRIYNGEIFLYIYGRGGYKDGIGNAYPFDYCFVYNPAANYLILCADSVKPKQ